MKSSVNYGNVKLESNVIYAETIPVTPVGNGAKIGFHKRYIGKNVLVLVLSGGARIGKKI